MAEIAVPRAELAALVGLPPDADDETLQAAMDAILAHQKAAEAEAIAAAAEQRLQAEDKRIVAAAINDGRLPVERAAFWVEACSRDREKNRAVISVLAKGLTPAVRAALDPKLDRVHNKVMASLGFPTEPRKSVAASSDPRADLRERAVLDTLGLPTGQTPDPVLLRKGVDPADYNREEQYRDFMHKLNLGRHLGVPKPPAGDSYYQPSPNDPYEFNQSTGQFELKPNNQARPI